MNNTFKTVARFPPREFDLIATNFHCQEEDVHSTDLYVKTVQNGIELQLLG